MSDETLTQQIFQELIEVKNQINKIFTTLHGNGREGLKTQVSKNTDHRNGANKLIWLLIAPLYGGIVTIILKMFLGG